MQKIIEHTHWRLESTPTYLTGVQRTGRLGESDQLHTLLTVVDGLKASGKPVSPEQDREFEVLKRKKAVAQQLDRCRQREVTIRLSEMLR